MKKEKEDKDEESPAAKHERWDRAVQRVIDDVTSDRDLHDAFELVTVLASALALVCVSAQTTKQRAEIRQLLYVLVKNIEKQLDRPPPPPEA